MRGAVPRTVPSYLMALRLIKHRADFTYHTGMKLTAVSSVETA
jgi:hypothetical protein